MKFNKIFTIILLFVLILSVCTFKAYASSEMVDGKTKNIYGEFKNRKILKQSEKYYLYTINNNTVIQLFDSNSKIISNTTNDFTENKFSEYCTVLDELEDINSFFKMQFNRDGDIGDNSLSISYINAAITDKTPNAIWTGNSLVINPQYISARDVLVHEYTHGIIQNELGKFHFKGQTGALEESLADVFATFYDDNYTIGEGLGNNNIIRSLSDPAKYGQPKHMNNYKQTSLDNGGVHINNSIPNYAYYLTSKKIGKEKVMNIYYDVLINRFNESSTFKSFKDDLKLSAEKLYSSKEAYQIEESWNEVGVK
ncbi:hypothetical protein A9958_13290 (plasmid) [Staphylococcus simulans]|uniref:M4 family metallopeptidase n=1 Tax=Staphylococcus simulans TaxID=1286 RepID=UPI000D0A4713|nr:M4 family metallopeptidase [Staphylococcus simulans]AVO03404.1 hypothetical protein BI282_13285 [Staphylococcus simulans]AVO06333.1 hypothetical protein BI283_13095 [Staphylococcus simulans]AWG19952.1 hypothetical protein A9958_13290 [Staphylococcus simulans]AWI02836.1 hypothetical protein A7X73_12825 [Staphylococcus simulans]